MGKVLWAVGMGTAAEQAQLLTHAKTAKASVVCIRSDNALLEAAIPAFHAEGMAVWAWRWPAVKPGPHNAPHYYAIDEANFVVDTLMPARLDGYIADIESDKPLSPVNDWDDPALQPLAAQFCDVITKAIGAGAPKCPGPFRFGLTAGCAQPTNNRHIPWATFVAACDTLYPQAYWRSTDSQGKPIDIHGGTPASSHAIARPSWSGIANGKPIVYMAGEVNLVTPAEIAAYGATTGAQPDRHFYADAASIGAQLAAVAAL